MLLQRPFKHGIRKKFNEWSAVQIANQLNDDEGGENAIVGLSPLLKMATIKPLILKWCIESWNNLQQMPGRQYVKFGWGMCCTTLYNVHDKQKRQEAVAELARAELEVKGYVPDGEENEEENASDSEGEEDDEKDELDVMKERVFGTRKSDRKKSQVKPFGYQISSDKIALSDDSEN